MLGLVLCAGIGAALAFIIERPFEGQLSAVTILGFLELLLVTVLIRAALRYRRRAVKRPLLSPQARRARALFLEELERSDIISGVVRVSHEQIEFL
jgi:ABC-type transport system involved in cytochrome bd biosynthesis fused ATPase/permease subunit